MSRQRFVRVIFGLILLLYAGTELSFLSTSDLTYDEGSHFDYGIRILKGNAYKRSCSFDDSKMPVSALNVLPRAAEQILHPGLQKNDNGVSDIRMGRYISFIFSLLSLIIIFKWSSALYGEIAGLFSMGLMAFCPNFLAHSGLVTTDGYSVLIILLVLYFLWRFLIKGGETNFILFCVFTGIAQLTKQTFLHLYICIPVLLLIYYLQNKKTIRYKSLLKSTFIFIVINVLIINAGFLFYKTGQPLNEYVFVSRMFNNVQHMFSVIGNIPLPLPAPYLLGMDTVKYFDELGGGFPESTFGVVSIISFHEHGKSYWFYYLVSMFFKTPIPTLIVFAITFFLLCQKQNSTFFKKHELILIIPVLYFLIIMSFTNNIQAGIRHILFLYPLLYILCGKLIQLLQTRVSKILFAAGCVWLLCSVYSYSNNYIPYTNEFIVDKKLAYQKVGHANLDFGQGYTAAEQYIKQHPDVQFAGSTPAKGRFLIAVGEYEDKFGEHTYNWLQQYPPSSHVKHAYLLIEVK
ncbi:MAG: glycosyltransferase family 39 protein [Chitinophagaceae bacterium]|nr:glycosyltransferase family 39 protein [Chitinophagaceae bacterium]